MSHHRAIALLFAAHGAVAGTLSTRIPWLQAQLDLEPGLLGLALLCPPIGAFVGMPMTSRLAYRVGGRTATRVLLAIWCALLPLPVLSPSPVWLFAAFVLFGAGAGMSDVAMNAHAVVLERHLGRPIMSGLHGMWAVGSLVAGGVGILAAQSGLDARLHLGAVAVALFAATLLAARGLMRDDSPADAPKPRRFALPRRSVALFGAIGFCGTFVEGSSTNWAAVYLTEVTEAGPGTAAAAYTVFMLFMAGTRLAGDRVIRLFGPVAAVRAGAAVAAVGGVVVVLSRTPAPAIAGFALIGLGMAVIVPLAIAAAGNVGTNPGEGVAEVASVTYLSGMIAPGVTGWVAGSASYPAAFAMITGVVVILGLLAPALRPSPGTPAAPTRTPAPGRSATQ